KWRYNTSGGSTGEPVRLIQDAEYEDRSAAISMLFFSLIGREPGRPMLRLWGSERDLQGQAASRKARFFTRLTNVRSLNAFRMSPAQMREFLRIIGQSRPPVILAYAQAIYELARFAESELIPVKPQAAIVS